MLIDAIWQIWPPSDVDKMKSSTEFDCDWFHYNLSVLQYRHHLDDCIAVICCTYTRRSVSMPTVAYNVCWHSI